MSVSHEDSNRKTVATHDNGKTGHTNGRALTRLCPNCVPVGDIQEHSRLLRHKEAEANISYDANTSVPLWIPRDRSENPGVGGSIPSLPTSFF